MAVELFINFVSVQVMELWGIVVRHFERLHLHNIDIFQHKPYTPLAYLKDKTFAG